MIYPNNNIENIFKVVHKTKDPKVIEWVIKNLEKFDYSSDIAVVLKDELGTYCSPCTPYFLIHLLINKGNLTEQQEEYVYLFIKAFWYLGSLSKLS